MLERAHYSFFWQRYTQELMQWQQGALIPETGTVTPIGAKTLSSLEEKSITRAATMAFTKKTPWFILLGTNVLHVHKLLQELRQWPSFTQLVILEDDSTKILSFQKKLIEVMGKMPNNVHILTDSSPWALLLMTTALGLEPEQCSLIFCEPPAMRSRCLQQWRKLFLGTRKEIPVIQEEVASLSLHVIMHPDEPHKEDFFAHIPSWIKEVLVLWDAPSSSHIAPFPCAAPVRHFYRPLQGDFAAQRNTLLTHSTGKWIFYLDADERLEPSCWENIKHLMQKSYGGGVLFVRMTFEGDDQHIRIGYGLWPDIQLRLFPHEQGVHFAGSVHEQVHGLQGAPLLSLSIPIWHYSHIHKTPEELQKRLDIFNTAGKIKHQLSAAYPALPKDFFYAWQKHVGHNLALRLPI